AEAFQLGPRQRGGGPGGIAEHAVTVRVPVIGGSGAGQGRRAVEQETVAFVDVVWSSGIGDTVDYLIKRVAACRQASCTVVVGSDEVGAGLEHAGDEDGLA